MKVKSEKRRHTMKKSLGPLTLAYPAPVWVVGTYDPAGRPNAMTAAWGSICCSQPPCVAVSLRKATYSYAHILQRKAFTVSIPSVEYVRQVDYFGIASERNEDKFAISGLTAVPGNQVDAPYVQEFPLVLECRLLHTQEIGLHTQFIGEILDVKAEEDILGSEGKPDISRAKPFLFDPGQGGYYGVGEWVGQAFSVGKNLLKSKPHTCKDESHVE
jgi:flavin reductase (DIM6/NTAB) family NADH-FMN oxidoreductase RutF